MARREVGLGQEAAQRGVPGLLLGETAQVFDRGVGPTRLQRDEGPRLDRAPLVGAVRRGALERLPRRLQPSLRGLQPAPEEPPLEEHGAVAALGTRQVPPLQARLGGGHRGVEAVGGGARLSADGPVRKAAEQEKGEGGAERREPCGHAGVPILVRPPG